jgi:hypothetical protein|eukprot:COSAG02_NODE_1060_length_14866_cov_3.131916_8_plen_179_part_00
MPIALHARRVGSAAVRATGTAQSHGAGAALSVAGAISNHRRRGLSSGPSESESVGFVGLGKIGFAMATNMMNAGYSLTVFDLDPAAVDRLVAAGATAAGSAAEAAAATSRLVTVLPNDAVLHQVVNEVAFGHMRFHLADCCADCDVLGPGEVSSSGWLCSRRLLHGVSTGGACCRHFA